MTSAVTCVVLWCKENISPQLYYLKGDRYVRIGGLGWEVRTSGTKLILYHADESVATLLTLKYGVPITVCKDYAKIPVDNPLS